MAINNPEPQDAYAPAAPTEVNDPTDQRFNSLSVLVAFPLFALIAVSIAQPILSSSGQREIGFVFVALAVFATVAALRVPYVAIVRSDGSLTFKALTRTVTTNLSRVERITRSSGARGGTTWIFYFDGTRAQLNNRSGRALAGYVVQHNPRVEYPSSLIPSSY
jgi:hypothetical protein